KSSAMKFHMWRSRTSRWRQLHLFQYCSAKYAVGVRKVFPDFKMVVPLHHRKRNGLAGPIQRGSKIPALTLKLRCLSRTVNKSHRCDDFVEVPLRAEQPFIIVSEPDVVRA